MLIRRSLADWSAGDNGVLEVSFINDLPKDPDSYFTLGAVSDSPEGWIDFLGPEPISPKVTTIARITKIAINATAKIKKT